MEELYTVAARTPATCVAMLRGGGVWRSFLLRGSQSDSLAAASGFEHRSAGGGAAADGVLALRRELFGANRLWTLRNGFGRRAVLIRPRSG